MNPLKTCSTQFKANNPIYLIFKSKQEGLKLPSDLYVLPFVPNDSPQRYLAFFPPFLCLPVHVQMKCQSPILNHSLCKMNLSVHYTALERTDSKRIPGSRPRCPPFGPPLPYLIKSVKRKFTM